MSRQQAYLKRRAAKGVHDLKIALWPDDYSALSDIKTRRGLSSLGDTLRVLIREAITRNGERK